MFSGLWAIANQEAQFNNKPPLGQAAPYLYSLPSSAIYDIVPVTSKNNVTATIKDANGHLTCRLSPNWSGRCHIFLLQKVNHSTRTH
jgi:hypothetical protein